MSSEGSFTSLLPISISSLFSSSSFSSSSSSSSPSSGSHSRGSSILSTHSVSSSTSNCSSTSLLSCSSDTNNNINIIKKIKDDVLRSSVCKILNDEKIHTNLKTILLFLIEKKQKEEDLLEDGEADIKFYAEQILSVNADEITTLEKNEVVNNSHLVIQHLKHTLINNNNISYNNEEEKNIKDLKHFSSIQFTKAETKSNTLPSSSSCMIMRADSLINEEGNKRKEETDEKLVEDKINNQNIMKDRVNNVSKYFFQNEQNTNAASSSFSSSSPSSCHSSHRSSSVSNRSFTSISPYASLSTTPVSCEEENKQEILLNMFINDNNNDNISSNQYNNIISTGEGEVEKQGEVLMTNLRRNVRVSSAKFVCGERDRVGKKDEINDINNMLNCMYSSTESNERKRINEFLVKERYKNANTYLLSSEKKDILNNNAQIGESTNSNPKFILKILNKMSSEGKIKTTDLEEKEKSSLLQALFEERTFLLESLMQSEKKIAKIMGDDEINYDIFHFYAYKMFFHNNNLHNNSNNEFLNFLNKLIISSSTLPTFSAPDLSSSSFYAYKQYLNYLMKQNNALNSNKILVANSDYLTSSFFTPPSRCSSSLFQNDANTNTNNNINKSLSNNINTNNSQHAFANHSSFISSISPPPGFDANVLHFERSNHHHVNKIINSYQLNKNNLTDNISNSSNVKNSVSSSFPPPPPLPPPSTPTPLSRMLSNTYSFSHNNSKNSLSSNTNNNDCSNMILKEKENAENDREFDENDSHIDNSTINFLQSNSFYNIYSNTLGNIHDNNSYNNNNNSNDNINNALENENANTGYSNHHYKRSDLRSRTTPAISTASQSAVIKELASLLNGNSVENDEENVFNFSSSVLLNSAEFQLDESIKKKAVRFSEFPERNSQIEKVNGIVEKNNVLEMRENDQQNISNNDENNKCINDNFMSLSPSLPLFKRSNNRSCSLPKSPEDLHIESKEIQLVLHVHGRCKPCAFYYNKKKGCRNGNNCEFCHHEDHAKLTLKQWKKQQQKLFRAVRSLKSSEYLEDDESLSVSTPNSPSLLPVLSNVHAHTMINNNNSSNNNEYKNNNSNNNNNINEVCSSVESTTVSPLSSCSITTSSPKSPSNFNVISVNEINNNTNDKNCNNHISENNNNMILNSNNADNHIDCQLRKSSSFSASLTNNNHLENGKEIENVYGNIGLELQAQLVALIGRSRTNNAERSNKVSTAAD